MHEEQTEERPKDGKSESPEEVNENNSQEQSVEETTETILTSDILPSPAQSQTENSKLQTEEMEIHAHELHKAPGHGWKHYTSEFLMLFFAVFCGFLAENLREHIIEVNIEHEYVKSFYEDLTADEKDLQKNINYLGEQARIADSLSIIMNHVSTAQPANLVYMYLRSITRSTAFGVNDRTIIQLRNAGA